MRIFATFAGSPESAFCPGQSYLLEVTTARNPRAPVDVRTLGTHGAPVLQCPYGSAVAFLKNWTNIQTQL